MTPALNRALAADLESSFEDLVVAFQDGLYRFAVSVCGDFARAEDIVQESLVRAYRALRGYDPDRRLSLALRPWLYRIALNVYRNSIRSRTGRLLLLPDLPESADTGPGPEETALIREDLRRIVAALHRLPEAQRSAVVLRHVHDLSYIEIAEVLDQPVGTIKSNVHRGVESLRRESLQEVS